MQKITVLGDGAWGSAIAHTLATAGHEISLWCYDKEVAHDIATHHENKKYLPGIPLHKNINPTLSLEQALNNTLIFVAIPVSFLRATLTQCAPYAHTTQQWVLLSKGIEQNSLALPSDILTGTINPVTWCELYGPTYAHDLAQQQPSGFTAAGTSTVIQNIQKLFPDYCTFEYSTDIHGIQIYAALKNILALGIGILEGAGYTDNTQALFFTRIFNEIRAIAATYGSVPETAFSLAGIGDALLTGYGKQSKNKRLGLLLGSGKSLKEALAQFPTAPESVNTLVAAEQLIHKNKIAAPCITMVRAYCKNNESVAALIQSLYI